MGKGKKSFLHFFEPYVGIMNLNKYALKFNDRYDTCSFVPTEKHGLRVQSENLWVRTACSLVYTRLLYGFTKQNIVLHLVNSVNISCLIELPPMRHVLKSKLVKRVFGSGKQNESGRLTKLHNEELYKLCCSTDFN